MEAVSPQARQDGRNHCTLVILFLSNDNHSRVYDLDLARELASDGRAGALLVLDAKGSD